MSVQAMVANQTLEAKSSADEAEEEELTEEASDDSSESSEEEEDPETGNFEPPDGILFESSLIFLR